MPPARPRVASRARQQRRRAARACPRKRVSRSEAWCSAAAGWYIGKTCWPRDRRSAPMHLADARAGQVALQRVTAEGHDHRRVEGRLLAIEVAGAGRDLLRLRVAVARRPALHDVGDEHVATLPSRSCAAARRAAARPARRTGARWRPRGRRGPRPPAARRSAELPSPATAWVRPRCSGQRVQPRTSSAIAASAARHPSASVRLGADHRRRG